MLPSGRNSHCPGQDWTKKLPTTRADNKEAALFHSQTALLAKAWPMQERRQPDSRQKAGTQACTHREGKEKIKAPSLMDGKNKVCVSTTTAAPEQILYPSKPSTTQRKNWAGQTNYPTRQVR
eukprot:TRINITY_DN6512_c0_g1_i1.p1 TRINITY_DN6512_c0_g1~~TRINITY_DN6512_c0_g1_i1.p1  ORF type:complete len:122 (+),score=14.45 TRINITY_DN6512_c0_g1_i1:174-539(+)